MYWDSFPSQEEKCVDLYPLFEDTLDTWKKGSHYSGRYIWIVVMGAFPCLPNISSCFGTHIQLVSVIICFACVAFDDYYLLERKIFGVATSCAIGSEFFLGEQIPDFQYNKTWQSEEPTVSPLNRQPEVDDTSTFKLKYSEQRITEQCRQVLGIIAAMILMVGLLMENKICIQMWIIIQILILIAHLIISFSNAYTPISYLAALCVNLVILVYFIFVVNSVIE